MKTNGALWRLMGFSESDNQTPALWTLSGNYLFSFRVYCHHALFTITLQCTVETQSHRINRMEKLWMKISHFYLGKSYWNCCTEMHCRYYTGRPVIHHRLTNPYSSTICLQLKVKKVCKCLCVSVRLQFNRRTKAWPGFKMTL